MKSQTEVKEVKPLISGPIAKKVLTWGMWISLALIVGGLVKMWRAGSGTARESSPHKVTVPVVCADTRMLTPSRANRVVELVAHRECLSNAIDLRKLLFSDRFEVDYYGDAEIYGCTGSDARDCFLHTGSTNAPIKPRRNYPDMFRVRGKNGPVHVRFRLLSLAKQSVRASSTKKNSLAEEVERQYQEILEMQRRRELLEKKRELEKEKKKLEKKLGKLEKG